MKQPFESNGYHDVEVLNPASPNTGDTDNFSGLKYVDLEGSGAQGEEKEGRARRKRRKLSGVVVLGVLALVAGLFFWMTMGGKKKIDLPVRDRNAQTDQAAARNAEDVTAQAIAEIRAAASPALASSPAP